MYQFSPAIQEVTMTFPFLVEEFASEDNFLVLILISSFLVFATFIYARAMLKRRYSLSSPFLSELLLLSITISVTFWMVIFAAVSTELLIRAITANRVVLIVVLLQSLLTSIAALSKLWKRGSGIDRFDARF
jgi:hypothetical protein